MAEPAPVGQRVGGELLSAWICSSLLATIRFNLAFSVSGSLGRLTNTSTGVNSPAESLRESSYPCWAVRTLMPGDQSQGVRSVVVRRRPRLNAHTTARLPISEVVKAMMILDLTDRRWLEFVEDCPIATTFHHPSWASVVARCYGYRMFALVQTDVGGEIIAGLPVMELRTPLGARRWVSLPFTDQCPPLARSTIRWSSLVEELNVTRREAKISSLEVRSQLEGPEAHRSEVAVTHSLRLNSDPDVLYKSFKRPSVRRQIKGAERDGVAVRREESNSALTQTFYRLHLATRRRLGVPIQPRRYFELLWRELIEPGLGFVLLAYANDVPVAGAVFLAWNGTVTYKYGASDASSWHLHPNHLLMWTAIRWGCQNGFQTFDFGRSDFASKGLRQFKDSWGSQEATLVYTTLGDRVLRPTHSRMHAAVGSIVRRSPPWVCRGMGELLYKYAA